MPENHVSDPITDQKITEHRERVVKRLWEIANLSPEITRNSVTGQVKALAMIVALQGLTPDGLTANKQSAMPSGSRPGPLPAAAPVAPSSDPKPVFDYTTFLFLRPSESDLGAPYSIDRNPFIRPKGAAK